MKSVEFSASKEMFRFPMTSAAFRALNLWNTDHSFYFNFGTFTANFDEYRPEFLENTNV